MEQPTEMTITSLTNAAGESNSHVDPSFRYVWLLTVGFVLAARYGNFSMRSGDGMDKNPMSSQASLQLAKSLDGNSLYEPFAWRRRAALRASSLNRGTEKP